MAVLARMSGWITEASARRRAGAPFSTCPACDACIVVLLAGRHLLRMRLGPDDTAELHTALLSADRCMQHAWAHAVIDLAEAATGEPLDEYTRHDVLAKAMASASSDLTLQAVWVASFETLPELHQQQILAFARGLVLGRPVGRGRRGVPDRELSHPAELVEYALKVHSTAAATVRTHLETAPDRDAVVASSVAVWDIAERHGIDIGSEPDQVLPSAQDAA